MSACVCLSGRVKSSPILVHVARGRGSVLLWRRCDAMCTSGLWTTLCLHMHMAKNRRREKGVAYNRSESAAKRLCSDVLLNTYTQRIGYDKLKRYHARLKINNGVGRCCLRLKEMRGKNPLADGCGSIVIV